jgi:hypothetical protein
MEFKHMSIRIKLALTLVTFLAALAFTGTASAQAGLACSGTVCGLGGQIRAQIGDGLPLPISIAPGYTGPFDVPSPFGYQNIQIHTQPATPAGAALVGKGLGQPGQIKPTVAATIMQTLGAAPRKLTLATGVFGYGPAAQGSIGVINFNQAVFAVQTNLIFDSPHPGTDGNGINVVLPATQGLSKGLAGGGTVMAGRPGLKTVSYYNNATLVGPGSPSNNYGNGNPPGILKTPAAGGTLNGVAIFTATSNQFGGIGVGRVLGTAKVFFNVGGLNPANDLPCTGTALCQFGISTVIPGTFGVAGGPFGGTTNNPAFTTPTGVFTGTIGFNGTIVGIGNAVTAAGVNVPFTGQNATSVGFPATTGRLLISVTDLAPGAASEMFVRTGIDARDANGNGVVATVTGAMSKRNISKGNANRVWTTYEVPEPSAIFAASAGLFALFGCHQLVRRRNR